MPSSVLSRSASPSASAHDVPLVKGGLKLIFFTVLIPAGRRCLPQKSRCDSFEGSDSCRWPLLWVRGIRS